MPGAHSSEPSGVYCSVAEAAGRLGCSEQMVRNLIKNGRLRADRGRWGRRDNIHRVIVTSVDDFVREHGRFRRRARGGQATDSYRRLEELEARLRRLESHVGELGSVDSVNLQFANLRLLEIHEEYGQALQEVLVADEHRANAVAALERIAAEYRAVVEQFHLPSGPPVDD